MASCAMPRCPCGARPCSGAAAAPSRQPRRHTWDRGEGAGCGLSAAWRRVRAWHVQASAAASARRASIFVNCSVACCGEPPCAQMHTRMVFCVHTRAARGARSADRAAAAPWIRPLHPAASRSGPKKGAREQKRPSRSRPIVAAVQCWCRRRRRQNSLGCSLPGPAHHASAARSRTAYTQLQCNPNREAHRYGSCSPQLTRGPASWRPSPCRRPPSHSAAGQAGAQLGAVAGGLQPAQVRPQRQGHGDPLGTPASQ
jgi:hypothetical protein